MASVGGVMRQAESTFEHKICGMHFSNAEYIRANWNDTEKLQNLMTSVKVSL